MYRYQTYSDVSDNCATLLCNVAGVKKITDLTIKEINDFLNGLDDYYKENKQNIKDFIE